MLTVQSQSQRRGLTLKGYPGKDAGLRLKKPDHVEFRLKLMLRAEDKLDPAARRPPNLNPN